ncbi:protein distal antenna [Diprion similis]|uniref:protein distal antenna n=1 Tax=Diprion similis TaxID=362088 RepID=UPI001EF91C1C|nr:protein distal antenna [Diprion similis]
MRGESAARPGKRPLRALSASEKMDAIQRVHEGESKASVARDIGVPESTLRGWCKSEHKIRGMARNSCTPDSEAHSPASSSVNANNSSLAGNSEDEGCTAKRQKTDADGGSPTEQLDAGKLEGGQSKIDYAALMASVAAIRPEGSGSLLLQQLGLLSTATNAIGKNLLHVPSGGGTQSSPVVGLVENGLQYTRSAGITKRQQQQQQQSTSAAAPSQLDTVDKSGSRNSLPPAAEAPFAPAPASPRKTNDDSEHPGKAKKSSDSKNCSKAGGGGGGGGGVGGSGAGADAAAGTGTVNNKVDEALWLWLTQQQQLLGQQSAIFSPGGSRDLGGSWFWKWYKQYGFAPTAPTPAAAVKKSPTKTRALLDNVLGNNNTINSNNNINIDEREEEEEDDDDDDEENVKRNTQVQQSNGETGDAQLTTEEAVAHGEKFLKWLEKCSQPSVSRMQIMQFRYLLNNLKTCRKPTSTFKRSRK